MIHDQLASGYGFLNLCGYQKCHEYHYFKESFSYRCLQNFYINTYHKLIPETSIENPHIIPESWYRHVKQDVDTSTKRSAIRDMMKAWVDWEEETTKILEVYYKDLYDQGEICAALKIADFLKDTSHELQYAQEKYLNLETSGYNIDSIIAEQKPLCKKYWEKMECIYEEDD